MCKPCIDPCKTCFGGTNYSCISCLDSSKFAKGTCIDCDSSCATCDGALDNNCLTCPSDYALTLNRTCVSSICKEGYFFNYSEMRCDECYSGCKTCYNEAQDKCITCFEQLTFIEGKCLTCSQRGSGYYTDESGFCREICGDGMKLDQNECDDGNRKNHDGC